MQYRQGATRQQGSRLQGGRVALRAGEAIALSGSAIQADTLQLGAPSVTLASAAEQRHDRLLDESHGLLGGYRHLDETRSTRQLASRLQAREIRIDSATLTLIGSSLEADQARITAEVLTLASAKDRDYRQRLRDDEGILLRKIRDRGRIAEQARPATLAVRRLLLDERTAAGDLPAAARERLIRTLSSEQGLDQDGIRRLRAVLENREWDPPASPTRPVGGTL